MARTSLQHSRSRSVQDRHPSEPLSLVEGILEEKLEDIATLLAAGLDGRSRLYEDVVAMVERSLFKIALRRSQFVKTAAASYLGMNRNTFQKKMLKLGISADGESLKRGSV